MDPKYFYLRDIKPLWQPLRDENSSHRVHIVNTALCAVSLRGINSPPPSDGYKNEQVFITDENSTVTEGFYRIGSDNYLSKIKN